MSKQTIEHYRGIDCLMKLNEPRDTRTSFLPYPDLYEIFSSIENLAKANQRLAIPITRIDTLISALLSVINNEGVGHYKGRKVEHLKVFDPEMAFLFIEVLIHAKNKLKYQHLEQFFALANSFLADEELAYLENSSTVLEPQTADLGPSEDFVEPTSPLFEQKLFDHYAENLSSGLIHVDEAIVLETDTAIKPSEGNRKIKVGFSVDEQLLKPGEKFTLRTKIFAYEQTTEGRIKKIVAIPKYDLTYSADGCRVEIALPGEIRPLTPFEVELLFQPARPNAETTRTVIFSGEMQRRLK